MILYGLAHNGIFDEFLIDFAVTAPKVQNLRMVLRGASHVHRVFASLGQRHFQVLGLDLEPLNAFVLRMVA